MARNNLVGAWGEVTAAEYLRKKRYTVVASGFRSRYGEIDLIACNKKVLVFVEVKLRKSADFAAPSEFVDVFKQRKLRTTAEYYLSLHPTELQTRFDVIEIIAPQGYDTVKPVIRHLEDAF